MTSRNNQPLSKSSQVIGSARWKPYPAYKDSGVEWLGEVPELWEVKRLKDISYLDLDQLPENTPSDHTLQYIDIGNVDSNGNINNSLAYIFDEAPSRARKLVRNGDTILSTVRTYLKAISLIENPPENLVVSTGFAVLHPKARIYPKFLWRLVQSDGFVNTVVAYSEGVSYPAITPSKLACLSVWVPLIEEQHAIAAFLDRETAKIDALIAKKRRLIELLQEKRTALISQAVTKGLDPNAPMKDSGVEWLGKIPEHWNVERSKRLFVLRKTRALPTDRQLTVSQKYGAIYQDEFMELEGRRVVQVIKGEDILYHIEPNDFVISMRSFQGGIEYCKNRGSVSSAYVVLKPSSLVHPRFFSHLLKSKQYIQALQGTTNLIRDGQALRYNNFTLIDLPMIPLNEQVKIANYIDNETGRIDKFIEFLTLTQAKLAEYRTALISAAVTGKIDVRAKPS